MKKISLFLAMCLMAIVNVNAGNDFSVLEGSVLPLKDSSVRFTLTWDYSECLIEGKAVDVFLKEKGDDWVRDYPGEIAASEATFAAWYNKKSKFALITDDADVAEYDVVIKVTKFDYGSTGASVAMSLAFGAFARKAGGASLDGEMLVYKKGTKDLVARLNIDHFVGDNAMNNTGRRTNVYFGLGKEFMKFLKKQK